MAFVHSVVPKVSGITVGEFLRLGRLLIEKAKYVLRTNYRIALHHECDGIIHQDWKPEMSCGVS